MMEPCNLYITIILPGLFRRFIETAVLHCCSLHVMAAPYSVAEPSSFACSCEQMLSRYWANLLKHKEKRKRKICLGPSCLMVGSLQWIICSNIKLSSWIMGWQSQTLIMLAMIGSLIADGWQHLLLSIPAAWPWRAFDLQAAHLARFDARRLDLGLGFFPGNMLPVVEINRSACT